jgi:hypothetical protein
MDMFLNSSNHAAPSRMNKGRSEQHAKE